MKNHINKILAFFLTALILLSLAVPTLAAVLPNGVQENYDYVKKETAVIGWTGFPMTVSDDGSFETLGALSVDFGLSTAISSISFENGIYPISTHRCENDESQFKLEQFVLGSENGVFTMYSRLTVKNKTEDDMSFPSVAGAELISKMPEKVEPDKTATAYYKTLLGGDGAAWEELSYKDAKAKAISYWDSVISSVMSVEISDKVNDSYKSAFDSYKKELIDHSISSAEGSASLVLSSYGPNTENPWFGAENIYASALSLMKTGNTEGVLACIASLEAAVDAHGIVSGELAYDTLSENLDALLDLQSLAYIMRVLSRDDSAYSEKAEILLSLSVDYADAIAKAIKAIDEEGFAEWETLTVDRSASLSVSAKDFESANSLCDWHVRSSVFTGGSSKELVTLAKEARTYYCGTREADVAILSLIFEREDGAIIVGGGAPMDVLKDDAGFSVTDCLLSTGESVSVFCYVDKKNVDFSFSGSVEAPRQIQFSLFEENIEYSSVGFDSASGVVTAPEGITDVSVRLLEDAEKSDKERCADASLEMALGVASQKSVDGCTNVSAEEFTKKLEESKKLRTATADEKEKAAEELSRATQRLSPMVAEYTYSIPFSEESIFLGELTHREICRKFSLPSTGRVDTVFVKGQYSDGISAAIYTLRGDAYTTDELRGETYGESVEGGILFDFDVLITGGEEYVLCIFSDEGDVTLYLEKSTDGYVHTYDMGEATVYVGATLGMEFSVTQADRQALDTFYRACVDADVSEYTKESRKALTKCMNEAKEILCTPSVTEEECNEAYNDLKDAFEGLGTYASEEKIEDTPVVGLVLIVLVVILLIATFVSAIIARKKMDPEV